MRKEVTLYHGSQQIVEVPRFGEGKIYNDYGQGFYCTESLELAKEWACPVKKDGYANQYVLSTEGLHVMYLTRGEYNILNWMALLLQNRRFDINNSVGSRGREYLLAHFLPELSEVDVIIGYRAEDSYFSFAEDFVNNTISVRDLNAAMRLGTLGEQVVLLSEKAFGQISFVGYEMADYREYYYKRTERDTQARSAYRTQKKELAALKEDLFILDILREELRPDDERLRCHLFE